MPPKCSYVLSFDRDARGMTPFMLAVSGRAYPAAITVLEAAQKMAKGKLISHLSALCSKPVCHLKGDCVLGWLWSGFYNTSSLSILLINLVLKQYFYWFIGSFSLLNSCFIRIEHLKKNKFKQDYN